MKILILFILFSHSAFAGNSERDCVQEHFNFLIFDEMEFVLDQRFNDSSSVAAGCDLLKKEPESVDGYPDLVRQYLGLKNRMSLELKFKKTITADQYFASDLIVHRGPEVSNEEVCEIVDAEIKYKTTCWRPKNHLEKSRHIDISQKDLFQLCQEHLPQILKNRKVCEK